LIVEEDLVAHDQRHVEADGGGGSVQRDARGALQELVNISREHVYYRGVRGY
jgi:hypothetical protein